MGFHAHSLSCRSLVQWRLQYRRIITNKAYNQLAGIFHDSKQIEWAFYTWKLCISKLASKKKMLDLLCDKHQKSPKMGPFYNCLKSRLLHVVRQHEFGLVVCRQFILRRSMKYWKYAIIFARRYNELMNRANELHVRSSKRACFEKVTAMH